MKNICIILLISGFLIITTANATRISQENFKVIYKDQRQLKIFECLYNFIGVDTKTINTMTAKELVTEELALEAILQRINMWVKESHFLAQVEIKKNDRNDIVLLKTGLLAKLYALDSKIRKRIQFLDDELLQKIDK